ncbi:MAG: precorrin-2 C(20)-methyltransferase [Clostridia bacterium]|nr:precorrin-2 C(20)-methyltransferase [Clostridia bacterium]
MKGKLYGVGVGPGDPELITLKAKRILEQVDYIAVPKTAEGKESLALKIVKGAVEVEKEIIELLFPMSYESKVLEEGWSKAVESLKSKLDAGKSIALITLGDPSVYSTYIYVHKILEKQDYDTEMIPGIPSFCASAARAGISLGENKETIAVIPSAYECEELDHILDEFDNVVLMKVSRNFNLLREKLAEKNLDSSAVIVSKCGLEDENIEFDLKKIDEEKLSYFSTVIVKKAGMDKK